jgi:pimeloyl-ACP methyl ester carboxylesterase
MLNVNSGFSQSGDDMLKTIQYKDGHTLSFNDYGDQNGYPILTQHGMIASIKDQQIFKGLIDVGARLISIARPGYGESSPYEMKNLGEWGEIVSILVEELGLAQFDVLGISSGAPYSYAIGSHCPDKARNLFILSGTPALFDEAVIAFWPYPINKQAGIAEMQQVAHEVFFPQVTEADLRNDDIRDSMAHNCFGIAQDLTLRCRNWGFPLSGIKAKVTMRHSRTDESVPFKTAELTASFLPNCRFEIRDRDVHFSQEVLDTFIREVIYKTL